VPGRYETLCAEIRAEFPRFRVMQKRDSRLHRAIHKGLQILSFGRAKGYLDGFQTTIGSTVYVTPDWAERSDDERYCTMRHELMHLRQFARWSLPLMGFLYLAAPLPLGLAWFRAHWEKEGYAETIRAAAGVWGLAHVLNPRFKAYVVEQFTGANYGWMWPFPRHMSRWYDAQVEGVRRELARS
jgi:hypothetical protein